MSGMIINVPTISMNAVIMRTTSLPMSVDFFGITEISGSLKRIGRQAGLFDDYVQELLFKSCAAQGARPAGELLGNFSKGRRRHSTSDDARQSDDRQDERNHLHEL